MKVADGILECLFDLDDSNKKVNYFRQLHDELELRSDVGDYEAISTTYKFKESVRNHYNNEWEFSKQAVTSKMLKEILGGFQEIPRNDVLDMFYQSVDFSFPQSLPSNTEQKPLSISGWWMVPVSVYTGKETCSRELIIFVSNLINSITSYVTSQAPTNNVLTMLLNNDESSYFSVYTEALDVFKTHNARLPQVALKKPVNFKHLSLETYADSDVHSFLIPVRVMSSTHEALFATRDALKEVFMDYIDEKLDPNAGIYIGDLQSKTSAIWAAHEQAWNIQMNAIKEKMLPENLYHFTLNVYRRKGEAVELKVVMLTTLPTGDESSEVIHATPVEDTSMLSSILDDFAHFHQLNVSWNVGNHSISGPQSLLGKPLSVLE